MDFRAFRDGSRTLEFCFLLAVLAVAATGCNLRQPESQLALYGQSLELRLVAVKDKDTLPQTLPAMSEGKLTEVAGWKWVPWDAQTLENMSPPGVFVAKKDGQVFLLVSDKPEGSMTQFGPKWGIESIETRASADCSCHGLELTFDAEGARQLATLSQASAGRYLAIIVAGKIQKAPAVRAALGNEVLLTFCTGQKSPDANGKCVQSERIERIKAQLMRLPAVTDRE
ncbi:MAG: hypothetical protein OEN01_11630 [Candidatus Krumholzibacteria bacterium]|nr:hypothetical protein [Candidatus Krumholzibacteria bacterium]MDH3378368.1 hypothetical protein [Gammaproteobacteria bacterium]